MLDYVSDLLMLTMLSSSRTQENLGIFFRVVSLAVT